MQIEVTVPGLLRDCVGGRQQFAFEVAASDPLDAAVRRLMDAYPLLRRHVYEESGQVRRHVLIFHNDENVARLERRDVPLKSGDRVSILQAVSGG